MENNSGIVQYGYYPNNLRSYKDVNGSKLMQVWDGSNLAMEFANSTGEVIRKYIRGINLLYSEDVDNKDYYLFNAHGDVVQLTDSTGVVTQFYSYDAFGNEQNPNPTDTNPMRYCGEYFDTETGTIYLRARYYDPSIGRFISEDRLLGNPADPLSLNLYTYCTNDPLTYSDPSGHFGVLATLAIKAGVGALISGGIKIATNIVTGNKWSQGVVKAMVYGAVASVVGGTVGNALSKVYTSAKAAWVIAGVSGATTNLVGGVIVGDVKNVKSAISAVSSGFVGGLTGYGTDKVLQSVVKSAGNALGKSYGSAANTITEPAKTSTAVKESAEQAIVKGTGGSINTPYGQAIQSNSKEALQVRQTVDSGGQLYRTGAFGKSNVTDAQFWAPENPLSSGYANKYGLANSQVDYIIGGAKVAGAPYITRSAPPVPPNLGGGIEVVTDPNSVRLNFFYMP